MKRRDRLSRRKFLARGTSAAAVAALGVRATSLHAQPRQEAEMEGREARPNILFVFADQMRAQALGCMGNRQVRTPNLDRLASEGVLFTHAVSSCPVCTPYRAALLTGRYPLSNGMVLNDVRLPLTELTIAEVLKQAGYQTGYIGKWHLDGPHRGGFTPPGPRRQGFDYWAVANCTHNYMRSYYYRDEPEPVWIEGYDADHQTNLAVDYMRRHAQGTPFCLFMSWGPPHGPYQLMPEEYKVYDPAEIELRPNASQDRREDIAGYYSHIAALDRAFGRLMETLEELGLSENTIVVFTSDHGDMLGSQGKQKKQKPWDESIMVPFVLRYPARAAAGRRSATLLNVVDVMPTLLGLAGIPVPERVEGADLSHAVLGRPGPEPSSAWLAHPCPFIEPIPEWRGVRTARYTYVRSLAGPWLLYDNENDPYQMENLVNQPAHAGLQADLEAEVREWLRRTGDDFQPREVYWERFGYEVDERKQMPYDGKLGNFD